MSYSSSPLLRHNVIMRSGYDRLFINLLYAIPLLMGWDNGSLFSIPGTKVSCAKETDDACMHWTTYGETSKNR